MRLRAVRIGTVTAAVVVCLASSTAQATPAPMLPDLIQAPVGCAYDYQGDPGRCTDWDVCLVANSASSSGPCVTGGPVQAVRLRFTTAEENIGTGPLLLYGHRTGTGTSTMTVRQAFSTQGQDAIPATFAAAQRATTASMYYEPAAMHQHWHMMGFEHFQLRTLAGGNLVLDEKNGVCLGDRYDAPAASGLAYTPHVGDGQAGALAQYLQSNNCDYQQPGALDVTEGISVGSGDDYDYDVDFQWLDITRIPTGTYDVVATVDSTHTLEETDYADNSSSIAVALRWPGGASTPPKVITAPPAVQLLRSCPGQASCPA